MTGVFIVITNRRAAIASQSRLIIIALSGNYVQTNRLLPTIQLASTRSRQLQPYMAQTVQRGDKGVSAGTKRKAAASSGPSSPVAKKAKTATARKSTGGKAPRSSARGAADAGAQDGAVAGTSAGARSMFVTPL